MIFFGWYADSVQHASEVASEQLENESLSREQKDKLESAKNEHHDLTWQGKLSFVFHFLLFVVACSVTGAGVLTYMSLSRDCEMVAMGDDQDCGEWSFIAGGIIALLIACMTTLSLYGVHIQYLAVTNCARGTISVLTIIYIPMGILMMHSAGLVRDLGNKIDENWSTLYRELNAKSFCDPIATGFVDDPCKDKLEVEVADNLGVIAGIFWLLTLAMTGVVVVNTLYARVLFAAHLEDLEGGSGKAGLNRQLSEDKATE